MVVWSAVSASCAIPGVFEPVRLIAKDEEGCLVDDPDGADGQLYSDGSFEADMPVESLSSLFNVNYFIASQVNPHVIPFMSADIQSYRYVQVEVEVLFLFYFSDRLDLA